MHLSPGDRLGRYEVLSLLGKGGMGEVYRARDAELDRLVAIKVLPGEVAEDPSRLARFKREAKAVAKLSHASILEIFVVGSSISPAMIACSGQTITQAGSSPTSVR